MLTVGSWILLLVVALTAERSALSELLMMRSGEYALCAEANFGQLIAESSSELEAD